ncbi:probable disease resistance protein At5g66890 [Durio zibethinus]|uniref:Probable disease resistance protein At5g66890 n=1 Tax=Durio zibethinus TaxID=66656 RepID=A0A6P5XBT1_DURZI|nr:probable disease resistance protein At5g66890 [Durio zibethinus]
MEIKRDKSSNLLPLLDRHKVIVYDTPVCVFTNIFIVSSSPGKMQHDLLRELAIYLSSLDPVEKRKRIIVELSSNNFPNWWLEEKQPPLVYFHRLLSVPLQPSDTYTQIKKFTHTANFFKPFNHDETFSFNWGSIQAPEVEVLVLNFRTKNYTLPVFMEKMEKLKILIVMNNGIYPPN